MHGLTTPLGLDGLDLRPTQGATVAGDADSFATELKRWRAAVEQRAELAKRGRRAVLERSDWAVVAAELLQYWEKCALH
jgi:glycosyltransferase involved in cell wall biosynthesis